jgi:uncharacterized protein with NAD-binding domain and iron-sulfur cluster
MATTRPGAGQKTRVLILGGGGGGVSTAFWLTATPALRDRFAVTLVTRGWRMGGKAASGRDSAAGARIEEHGLHILMGCYHDAFRTIVACYDEWRPGPDGRFQSWRDAFTPQRQVYLWEGHGEPPWRFDFPKLPGQPGDSIETTVLHLLKRLHDYLSSVLLDPAGPHADRSQPSGAHAAGASASIAAPLASIDARLGSGDVHRHADALLRHADALHQAHAAVRADGTTLSTELERLWILGNLGLSVMRGLFSDILPHILSAQGLARAFDRLDAMDFRAWLRGHGASETTLAAPPVSALYDLAFAYRDGDASDPAQASMAAGVTLRFALDLVLDYRDAPVWRMNAGMGDTIFTPFHDVLKARGVEIRLFHAVREIRPSPDGGAVQCVVADRQVTVIGGDYRPFVRVKGLDCWPDAPLWDQIEGGEALRKAGVNLESFWDETSVERVTFERGRDFDIIVLATPPEMTKRIAPDLGTSSPRFGRMLSASVSVATRSTQLWLRKPLSEMAPYQGQPIMATLPEPYDSWAEMSELLAAEDWPADDAPRSIAYLCGVMKTPDHPGGNPIGDANAVAQASARAWLSANAATVWPQAGWGPEPLPDALIRSAYFRGNVEPSELYVLTPAGSVEARLDPGGSGYGNMVLAGDWTRTRYSGGCFESTVESGILAARAIIGASAGSG